MVVSLDDRSAGVQKNRCSLPPFFFLSEYFSYVLSRVHILCDMSEHGSIPGGSVQVRRSICLRNPTTPDVLGTACCMLSAVISSRFTWPAMGVLQFPSSAAKNARSQSTAVYAGRLGARSGQEGGMKRGTGKEGILIILHAVVM